MKKIMIFFIIGIIGVTEVQAQEYSDLKKLKSTHKIKSEKLLSSLQKLLVDNEIFGEFESDIVVIKVENNPSDTNIFVTKTDFRIFKNYRPDFFEQLKGYTQYKNFPVLLFGDIKNDLFDDLNEKFYDVVGPSPVYTKVFPPTIYDPKIVCLNI